MNDYFGKTKVSEIEVSEIEVSEITEPANIGSENKTDDFPF
jgi:hypothetical protein